MAVGPSHTFPELEGQFRAVFAEGPRFGQARLEAGGVAIPPDKRGIPGDHLPRAQRGIVVELPPGPSVDTGAFIPCVVVFRHQRVRRDPFVQGRQGSGCDPVGQNRRLFLREVRAVSGRGIDGLFGAGAREGPEKNRAGEHPQEA